MSEKTWKLQVNEDELKALISFHKFKSSFDVETSARIHDLTKRLSKKDEPEITKDEPQNETQTQDKEGW